MKIIILPNHHPPPSSITTSLARTDQITPPETTIKGKTSTSWKLTLHSLRQAARPKPPQKPNPAM